MSEPLVLLMLLVILVLPAVLIARTGRRLGRDDRLRRQLGVWAELRGWRLVGPDEHPLGRWQVWPFTAADREVDEVIAGVHRGREVTSRRMVVRDGDRRGTFHVMTVGLDGPAQRPVQPRTLIGEGAERPDAGPHGTDLARRLGAVTAAHPELSVRREARVLVGWLPGPPLLSELNTHLDALAEIADAADAR